MSAIDSKIELCPVCGGTGINPCDSKYKCIECGGNRVVNHFKISMNFIIPYADDTVKNENIILHHIEEMKKDLGLEYFT